MRYKVLPVFAASILSSVASSQEIDWKPVTQLRATAERIEFITKTGQREDLVVIITGVVSADQFKATVGDNLTGGSSIDADPDPVEIGIERQELPIDDSDQRPTPWAKIDIEKACKIFEEFDFFNKDIVPDSQIDSVFTMPLPLRSGKWSNAVSHPELKDSLKLVRFIDFTVMPGHYYRYRARIGYINPRYKKDPDPFVAYDELRYTPWSVPCPALKVVEVE